MTALIDALKAEAAKPRRQPIVAPKNALNMSPAESAAAKRELIDDARQAWQKADDARQLAAITTKYSKEKTK